MAFLVFPLIFTDLSVIFRLSLFHCIFFLLINVSIFVNWHVPLKWNPKEAHNYAIHLADSHLNWTFQSTVEWTVVVCRRGECKQVLSSHTRLPLKVTFKLAISLASLKSKQHSIGARARSLTSYLHWLNVHSSMVQNDLPISRWSFHCALGECTKREKVPISGRERGGGGERSDSLRSRKDNKTGSSLIARRQAVVSRLVNESKLLNVQKSVCKES